MAPLGKRAREAKGQNRCGGNDLKTADKACAWGERPKHARFSKAALQPLTRSGWIYRGVRVPLVASRLRNVSSTGFPNPYLLGVRGRDIMFCTRSVQAPASLICPPAFGPRKRKRVSGQKRGQVREVARRLRDEMKRSERNGRSQANYGGDSLRGDSPARRHSLASTKRNRER